MTGIDEVGRGCWAGPLLVVAARQAAELQKGLKDSKKLSKKQRENLFYDIQLSCDLGEGWVTAVEIDRLGLTNAMRLGVARALESIGALTGEKIIMDGAINYCGNEFENVKCEPKADDKYPIVSAASVYAKVTRDKYMANLRGGLEKYEFSRHVGYGTAVHANALKLHGPCSEHRLSFAPVAKFATL